MKKRILSILFFKEGKRIEKFLSLLIVCSMIFSMLPSMASIGEISFDLTTGSITVENGTGDDTIKVIQDGGETIDNISSSTVINFTQTDPETTTSNRIIVSADVSGGVNIKLSGVNIRVNNSAFEITASAGKVNLILVDDNTNTFKSIANNYDALQKKNTVKNEDGLLTISCEGALTSGHTCSETCGKLTSVASSFFGAGIGGSNIKIYGGNINANGGHSGAGIGGGNGGSGNYIYVYGGNITATGGKNGAGIGGGDKGNGNYITISGGIVEAIGGSGAAGIGGGSWAGSGNYITIESGMVNATGYNGGAGIGGGSGFYSSIDGYIRGQANNITISGGTVMATAKLSLDSSNTLGCDIGGGGYSGSVGSSSNFKITGGNIYAPRIDTTPINDNGAPVYKATLTITGDATGGTTLDAISFNLDGTPYRYNINDTKSILVDDAGKLFVYLPLGTYNIEYSGKTYIAEVDTSGKAQFTALPVLSEIIITTPPRTTYKYGEAFSKDGMVVKAIYDNGSEVENFTDYTVDKTDPLTMSDTTVTITANENSSVKATQNITVDKADISNSGGSATVTYTGATFDLNSIDGLFTVDSNAGERTYSIETGGTGVGTISGNTLAVTKAGTLIIGLETAETENYAAGSKVTATLTVNKGTQPDTPSSKAPGNNNTSPPAPTITVTEIKSELFTKIEDIVVEADVENAFGQPVEVRITDDEKSQNEMFQLAGADGEVYPFDISLYSKTSGKKVQPKEGYSVKVTLPIPEKLLDVKEKVKVVHINNGKPEVLSSQLIEKDGKWYISFEAVHFSPYALVVSPEPSKPWANPFSDVKESDWYCSAVQFVAQNGLMVGTGNDTFSPGMTTNRGMIVSILYRISGLTETLESSFRDVIPGVYYANAVAWAQKLNIISGYGNGMFGPEDTITREQMISILWRYAGSPVDDIPALDNFKDTGEISEYANVAFAWAYKEGIIIGKGNGILDPKGLATRGEVAKIIDNFVKIMK